jgi:tetratricopeptide (TPR) repeat protein
MGPHPLKSALVAAVAVATWACPSAARAGDDEELNAAVARVEAAKYKEAAERFERLLDPRAPACPSGPEVTADGCQLTNPELKKRAREHYAVALYAAGGRTEEARAQIEAILRADPTYQPNPTLFPQPLMNLYIEVKGRLSQEIADAARKKAAAESRREQDAAAKRAAEDAYVRALEKQAAEEKVVRRPSRYVAAMPFGAGQFQNGDIGLGLFFGISQLLAGGVAIGAEIVNTNLTVDGVERDVNRDAAQAGIDTARTVNLVAMGIFGLSAVSGIAEAQISFESESVEMRTRPIPKRLPTPPPAARVIPAVVPMNGGAGLGAVGRF